MSDFIMRRNKTVYQTSDGVIHTTLNDAREHQGKLNVMAWVAKHGAYGKVEADDITENWTSLCEAMNPKVRNLDEVMKG